jgi:hypothetical protein
VTSHRRTSASNKPSPIKPAGGTVLCLTEPQDVAYNTIDAIGFESYYTDSGATGHYVNELEALHDYVSFEAPGL